MNVPLLMVYATILLFFIGGAIAHVRDREEEAMTALQGFLFGFVLGWFGATLLRDLLK